MKTNIILLFLILLLNLGSSYAIRPDQIPYVLNPPPNQEMKRWMDENLIVRMPLSWYYLNVIDLIQDKKYDRAQVLAIEGLEFYPASIDLYYALALALHLDEEYEKARFVLGKMLLIDPDILYNESYNYMIPLLRYYDAF